MAIVECCQCGADNSADTYYSCSNCGHSTNGCCTWIGQRLMNLYQFILNKKSS